MSEWQIEEEPRQEQAGGWQIEEEQLPQQQVNASQQQANVQQSLPPQQEESLGKSIGMWPFRVTYDVGEAGINALRNSPEYLNKTFTELNALPNLLQEHPKEAFKQYGAGFAEAGSNAFNMPHDVLNYVTNRLHLFPKSWNEKVQMSRSDQDLQEAINQTLGVPERQGEEAMRFFGRHPMLPVGIAKGLSMTNPLQYSPVRAANRVLRVGENVENKYANRYGNVFNKAQEMNLGTDLPNTLGRIDFHRVMRGVPSAEREAMNNFRNNPTPETAHFFKSDLLRESRKLERKFRTEGLGSGESKRLDAIRQAIGDIEGNMFNYAPQNGNIFSRAYGQMRADMLANKYRNTQQGFEREVLPYRNPDIARYREGRLRAQELIPKLRTGEFAARREVAHPEIFRPEKFKNALNVLRNVTPTATSLGLILYLLSQGKG